MTRKIRLILSLMDKSDHSWLRWIFLTGLLNGVFNVIGIASILPFISVVSQPEIIQTNKYILVFSEYTGLDSYSEIIFSFGAISFVMILVGNIIGFSDTWIALKFGYIKEQQLGEKLLSNYLDKDVLSYKNTGIPEKARSILAEIDRVIIDTLFAYVEIVSGTFLALLVFALLLMVDVTVALSITAILLTAYLLIYSFTAKRLRLLGKEFADIETDLYADVLEPLEIQPEIKLAQISDYYTRRYASSFSSLTRNSLKSEFISLIPQQLLEIVAFGGIIIMALYFSLSSDAELSVVGKLSLYAFAAYRLMPAIAEIFDSFEKLQFGSAVLNRLVDDFVQGPVDTKENDDSEKDFNVQLPELFLSGKMLELNDVTFQFPHQRDKLFESLTISFELNKFHCLYGRTGCGKSSLLNIVAGLYSTAGGKIRLAGTNCRLFENKEWYGQLAYVPGKVNLVEGSVLENIALGICPGDIDQDRAVELAKLVEIDEHINGLDEGYQTVLGESGLSLSSGQTQKIGIARGLYRNPKLFLLDEATDALDIGSEERIVKRLKKIDQLTLIFVSHRPSIHELADNAINLEMLLGPNGASEE